MIGRIVGNYRIVEKVGEGGMGTVYRAVEQMVERDVAIKVLREEFVSNPELNERFRTEAVALAKLNHPAIATLYSYFRDGNEMFMAMEFVPGETLEQRIQRQGAMPWPQAVEVLLWSLDAVRHAHKMGILHRDLKPANIMITPDGRVKVTDFGIARVLNAAKLTREARIVGTVEYLAPERALGRPADERSDLYSLGVVLYEMIIGRVPFHADSDIGLLRAQIEEEPRPPRELGVSIPAEVERALMKSLAKDPDQRFPDAAAFAAAFREAVRSTGMPLGNRPTRLATSNPPAPQSGQRPGQPSAPRWGAAASYREFVLRWWSVAVDKVGRQYAVAGLAAAATFLLLGLAVGVIQWLSRPVPRPVLPAVSSNVSEPQPFPFTEQPRELEPIAPPVVIPSPNDSTKPNAPATQRPATPNSPGASNTPATTPGTPAKPDKPALSKEAVLAALDERDQGGPGPAGHPIHFAGLLKALRLGGGSTPAWIAEVIERRGVNFHPSGTQMTDLRAAGAPETLLLAIANSYRPELTPPAPAQIPPPPVLSPPSTPAPTQPAPRSVKRLTDVRRLSVDAMEPEVRNFLYQELEEAFRGQLNIIRTGPADAVLRVRLEAEGGNKVVGAASRVFGMKDKVRAVAEVAEARDGVVLWKSVAGDRSFGGLGNGARRVASRVAKQLKDDWKN